tara:strand:- start:10026 stop:11546 length:1521 start_codon:yes stop_codon:yes gene_type:complete
MTYIPAPNIDDPVKVATPLDYNLVFFQGSNDQIKIHPNIGVNLPIHNLLLREYEMTSGQAREIIHMISQEKLEKQPALLASAIKQHNWMVDHTRMGRIIKTYKDEALLEKWGCGRFTWDEDNTVNEIEFILIECLFNPLKKWRCLNWRAICSKYEDVVIAQVVNRQISAYGWRVAKLEDTRYNNYREIHMLDSDCAWCEELEEYDLKDNLWWSEENSQWINTSRTERFRYCEDIDQWLSIDECFYCDFTDTWKSTPPENRVLSYHYRTPPNPIKEPIGAKWTIGFEIEKESVYNEETGQTVTSEGDPIEDQPFFWKWETDSSVGIEGVSNAYDLFESKEIRQDVRLSNYIDAPVDTKRAGGHVSIKCNEYTRSFGLADIRPYAGLIYALWRHRLKSEYCSKNKKLDEEAYLDRYDVIRVRGANFLEFRLPSRVKNKKQLIWRYKLFHCTIRAMQESKSFDEYLRNTSSLLDEVYGLEKKDKILRLAKSFENYLINGVISSNISEFI